MNRYIGLHRGETGENTMRTSEQSQTFWQQPRQIPTLDPKASVVFLPFLTRA